MKIKFDPNLDFQHDAIESIVRIFKGQETCQSNFTVSAYHLSDRETKDVDFKNFSKAAEAADMGYGNDLIISPEEILENVRAIQIENGLKQSDKIDSMDFTVEMETGTGKTYVYLRSIYELNKRYGFTKFIIVVPSVAIKEGVAKSLEMTYQHFKELYNNVQSEFFVYDSDKPNRIRDFAVNDHIEIMVINIDAFRRSFTNPDAETKANRFHRSHDKLNGAAPRDLVQATNPIVIIDEPQSVDNTTKAKEAIASLNPMCCLRYSATHKEKYNLMYKLDAVDAYEQKLVKQIEVASLGLQDAHNEAYIKLLAVDNKNGPISAKVEIDVQSDGKISRKTIKVKSGDDLYDLSNGRDVYDGYMIEDIYCEKGYEYIGFSSRPDEIKLGQAIGGMDDDIRKREQIRKTIEEHLDKELRLLPQGIKVLSLFFVDKVANYRSYDEEKNPIKGKFAKAFEEEYSKAIKKTKYHSLFEGEDLDAEAEKVHNGYFAIDGKKKDNSGEVLLKDSTGEGKTQADESAYHLIMKDKERLLNMDCKLKFIFSHSALKEGWDNPNVFQICTLNETGSTMKKRQEIGRGLRICVNQEGERVHGFEVNTLTVMANESYHQFVEELQKEIAKDSGIKFQIVEKNLFANMVVETDGHKKEYFGELNSKEVWKSLNENNYISSIGKVQDSLKAALKVGKIKLPKKFKKNREEIILRLKKVSGSLEIKNRDERVKVNLNKQVFLSEEFKELWEQIKYKSTYRVNFNTEGLIERCSEALKERLIINREKIEYTKAFSKLTRGGIVAQDQVSKTEIYGQVKHRLPDIISFLQNETNLKRSTVVNILFESEKLNDFKRNPQKFIAEASAIIKSVMRTFIVDGISYQRLGDECYYAQELFAENELFGYLEKNMLSSEKSVFDHVVYDSTNERSFAVEFERNENVKLYAKLPGEFKIDTPLGSYNPDWAVLISVEGEDKLYFVVESKGSIQSELLRPVESAKIKCGRKHFEALGTKAQFKVADSPERVLDAAMV